MEAQTALQFDIEKAIAIGVQSGATKKMAQVKFGIDAAWCERNRKSSTIKRSLGRGKSSYDASGSEAADLDLLEKIRVDTDGPEFDKYEAAALIGKLEATSDIETARSGDAYVVRFRALGCDLLHELRIPTQAQIVEYSRSSVRVTDERRLQNIRVLLEPSGALYDKLVVRSEGYAAGVPIIHKAAVISELIADLQASDDDASF
ncbi:MAG TPA: hypothetical protein VHB50_14295 [Bryobacteraceae bacterium]|nr:hypothetical protein [Bryobacteraceae bacterium]